MRLIHFIMPTVRRLLRKMMKIFLYRKGFAMNVTITKFPLTPSTPCLKGQCHRDLLLFQKPKNVFGLTETVN